MKQHFTLMPVGKCFLCLSISTGWKVSLDRGLDIFQLYDMNNAFQLSNRLQQHRACKAFEITYIKINE
ncbi:MAG: hypothetical protein KAG53_08390 [Endozoicomonadaceae bacterium]|nr:hypothetical protein [Endozoicomonadaceae bacterium]